MKSTMTSYNGTRRRSYSVIVTTVLLCIVINAFLASRMAEADIFSILVPLLEESAQQQGVVGAEENGDAKSTGLRGANNGFTSPLKETEEQELRFFDGSTGCRLDPASVRYLGRGFEGLAYTAEMTCIGSDTTETVAFKINRAPMNDGGQATGPQKLVSDPAALDGAAEALFKRLSQQQEDRFFVEQSFKLRFATMKLSPALLAMATKEGNRGFEKEGTSGMYIVNQTVPEEIVQATLTRVAPGRAVARHFYDLGEKHRIPGETAQQIVRDLIHMYWFFYKRQVVNKDASLTHLYFSESLNQTSLIDFDHYTILNLSDEENALLSQQGRVTNSTLARSRTVKLDETSDRGQGYAGFPEMQQTQLLSFIGSVCLQDPSQFPSKLYIKREKVRSSNLMARWNAAFKECGFKQQIEINESSLDETARTYEMLANWSGLGVRVQERSDHDPTFPWALVLDN